MSNPKIILSHIAAVSKNNVIGFKNKLPWRIPGRFKVFLQHNKKQSFNYGKKNFSVPW